MSAPSWSADPDRPKNDKATILADTIQLLKELTSQVNKLKAEYASLTEESREVILNIFHFDNNAEYENWIIMQCCFMNS